MHHRQRHAARPIPRPDRAKGGLGVGLTLARRLVDLHAGTLTASSAGAGRGSEFRIALPRAAADSVRPVVAAQPQAEGPRPSASLRVLVIDDYVDATRALERLLGVMGHEVIVAHDGKSGIELAERVCPDVILLDIGLPEMDGHEVGRRIRQDRDHGGVLLVALTGYGQEEDRRRSRQAGFDAHLVKPPAIEDLERVLEHPKLAALRSAQHANLAGARS